MQNQRSTSFSFKSGGRVGIDDDDADVSGVERQGQGSKGESGAYPGERAARGHSMAGDVGRQETGETNGSSSSSRRSNRSQAERTILWWISGE